MTTIKNVATISTRKLLMAAATLATLMAVSTQYASCFVWFNQPEMPSSLRKTED